MTERPSETAEDAVAPEEAAEPGESSAAFAGRLASLVGGVDDGTDFDTVRVAVARDRWVDAVRVVRDEADLVFLSWLSAIDWSREVAVGEPVDDVDALEERYEVIARLSSLTDAAGAHLVTTVPKDDPWIDSLVSLFPGAEWHERETAEMFGIDFRGNPNLTKLYLPDGFEGFPLRKSYPLLSREVKPWPGKVDVEDMPSTENVEADEAGSEE